MQFEEYKPEYDGLIDTHADRVGVPKTLLRALVRQESSFNPRAVNGETGAAGLGQLMEGTAKALGVTDRFDPEQSIRAAADYLREGYDREGTTRGALHYYYGGPDKGKWGPKTRTYPDQVLRHIDPKERAGMTWAEKQAAMEFEEYQEPTLEMEPFEPEKHAAAPAAPALPGIAAPGGTWDEMGLGGEAPEVPEAKKGTGPVIDLIPEQPAPAGPPVRPEVRRAIEMQAIADPSIQERPDFVGQVARLDAPETQARIKMLYEDAIRRGATPEAAKQWAERNAVIPDEARASASTFDFETAREFEDANVLTRAGKKIAEESKRQAGGVVQAALEMVGADASRVAEVNRSIQRTLEALGEGRRDASYLEKQLEGALVSIGTQGPQMLYAVFGGPAAGAVGLGSMFMQQAGAEYAYGRDQGLDTGEALQRAAFMGAAEVVGESVGMRAAKLFAKGLLESGVDAKQLIPAFARYLAAENVGEQATSGMQFGFDRFADAGLQKEATLADYLRTVMDTGVQTTMQTLLTGAAGAAVKRATGQQRAEDAEAAANAAREEALAKWAQFNEMLRQAPADAIARPVQGTEPPEPTKETFTRVGLTEAQADRALTAIHKMRTEDEKGLRDFVSGAVAQREAEERELAAEAVADGLTRQDAVRLAAKLSRETGEKHRPRMVGGVNTDTWVVVKEKADAVQEGARDSDAAAQPDHAAPAADVPVVRTEAVQEVAGPEAAEAQPEAPSGVGDAPAAAAMEVRDAPVEAAATEPAAEAAAAPAPGPAAQEAAVAETPEVMRVIDVYGKPHYVAKAELDGDRTQLRKYNAKGERLVEGGTIHRENIDLTGEKRTALTKDRPYIAAEGDKPFRTRAALAGAMARVGASPEDFEVTEVEGGFIAKRKAPAAPTVDAGAHEAAVSPQNDRPEPTPAQILANNAKLGTAKFAGRKTRIENPAGSVRRDLKHEPPEWETKMLDHYGRLTGVEAYDGDELDVFLTEGTPEDYDGPVFVVNQVKGNGHFDEHKVVAGLGVNSIEDAQRVYRRNYEAGWDRDKSIVQMTMDEFNAWIDRGGPKEGEARELETVDMEPADAPAKNAAAAPAVEPVAPEPARAENPREETPDGQPSTAETLPERDARADRGDGPVRGGRGEPLDAGVAGSGQEPAGERGVPASARGDGGAREGRAGGGRRDAPGAPRGNAGVRAGSGAAGLDDFQITDADAIGEGGLKKKYRDNVAAIKLLKAIEAEGRKATADERKKIAKYVGWGGMKGAFDPDNKGWAAEHAELKALLTEAEYVAARKSILNAHYTSPAVVSAMYEGLGRLGFTGGRVLEPSVGVGNFFGLMPRDLRGASKLFGVELDSLTSRIAGALYPSAKITQSGFQDYQVPAGYFDVAIGNPPFGSEPLVDGERTPYSGFSIHNYFFAKSLDKLREGGLLMMVVSHSFMDKMSPAVRRWIAQRADLVSAVRLPNTAFKENANTEVVTDIIVLKKVAEREAPKGEWLKTTTLELTNAKSGEVTKAEVNDYFLANPQNVLGRHSAAGSMYRANEYTVDPTGDIKEQLASWVASLPQGQYEHVERGPELDMPDVSVPDGVKIDSYYVAGDTIMQRGPDVAGGRSARPWTPPNDKAAERMRGLIGLREAMRSQIRLERDPDATEEAVEAHRKVLNQRYDTFVKKFGFVNNQVNRRLFMEDPEAPLVQGLERDYDKGIGKASKAVTEGGEEAREPSASKMDILSRRVLFPPAETLNVTSAKDALLASLNLRGRLDLPYMVGLYRKDEGTILKELGDLVYIDPERGPVMADEYLSGDVKTKLEEARAAAKADGQYQRNVEALERVIPKDLLPSQIYAAPGAAWVPEPVYQAFLEEISGRKEARVSYLRPVATWIVDRASSSANAALEGVEYGTSKLSATELFGLLLNGRAPMVYKMIRDANGDERRVVDETATEQANEKYNKIRAKWESWVWSDPERAVELAALYNDRHNRTVERKHDGTHLTFPGMSPVIELRKSQKDAVWRGLQDGAILLDHVVGAGKTFTGVAMAMEMRRLGKARKPIFVVPNHLTLVWRQEFYRLYPDANVLAATPEDFTKENRKRLFSKIVTGDWDAVIVGHSSLKKIGLPPETEKGVLEEQISELSAAIEAMKKERGDRNVVRDMEKIKANLEAKMKQRLENVGERDDVVTWDELGVDALFVDEFHEFKNLFFHTQKQRVAGLGNPAGSAKAFDMFVKIRWLQDTYGAQAPLVTMTGTPVSNSLTEMYTMQRYMQYPALKADGLHLFDAWAKMYGDDQNVYEVAPSGVGYRVSQRFAKFKNMPSLMAHYRSFADVITMDELKANEEALGRRFPVPKVKGGRPQNVVAKKNAFQNTFIGEPVVQRGDDGSIAFGVNLADEVSIEQSDGRWLLKVGNVVTSHETEEAAAMEYVARALTPDIAFNEGSLLDQFARLKELTRQTKGKINALSLTNLANKVALDYRMIDPNAPDQPGSKINEAVDNIVRIYRKWNADRGTQLVFLDLSVPLSARAAVAAKEARVYIRDEAGKVTHARGTLHTIEGREGFPFYLVAEGKAEKRTFTVYEPMSGARIAGGFASKAAARDAIAKRLETDAGRDAWYDVRSRTQALTEEEIEDYKNEQEFDEESGNELSLTDIEGVSGNAGWSAYDDMKAKLIAAGIPEREIAFIHDYHTPKAKAELFRQVNAGQVRVLFGSTPKMGAGTNVQERAVALHHIDAPWRPSDLEQREGRIVRQGNRLYQRDPDGFEVEILRYATEQTYDTRRWQLIEHKAAGVEQLRHYSGEIELEDVAGEAANAAEMKAAASGSPLILKETELRTEVRSLENLRRAHADEQATLAARLRRNRDRIAHHLPAAIKNITRQLAAVEKNPMPEKGMAPMTIDGKKVKEHEPAAEALGAAGAKAYALGQETRVEYRGLAFVILKDKGLSVIEEESGNSIAWYFDPKEFKGSGLITRLNNYVGRLPAQKADLERELEAAKRENEEIGPKIGVPFAEEARLLKAKEEHAAIQRRLMKENIATAIKPAERAEVERATRERAEALKRRGFEVPADDAVRFARAFKRQTSAKTGMPLYFNEEVFLGAARLVETQPIERDLKRYAFDIMDSATFKRWLPEVGAERALAKAKAGEVLVDMRGDEFVVFHNIQLYPSKRGQGHGQAVVGAMLKSQDTPMLIRDIQEDAVDFWAKMGAKFPRSTDYMEATLDRFQYATHQRQRGRPDDDEARPETLGADDRRGEEGAGGAAARGGQGGEAAPAGRHGGNRGPAFRRADRQAELGFGFTAPELEALLKPIVARWANAPELVVLESMAQAPYAVRRADAQQRAGGASGPPYAFFYGGKVYVIASEAQSERQAIIGLFHEALGHYGLRGVFGNALNDVLDQLWLVRRSEVAAMAEKYGIDVATRDGRREAAEELLAHMAQTRPELGFVRRAIAAIRAWLREAGILLKVTDDDIIRDIIIPARRFVERGARRDQPGMVPAFARAEQVPIWVSELARQVEAIKTTSAPAPQWIATLKSLKGVKADELEWSGVLDWLATREGKVSKADIAAYLDANGVKVEEVMLGEDVNDARTTREFDRIRVELDAMGYTIEDTPELFGVIRRSDGAIFTDERLDDNGNRNFGGVLSDLGNEVREKVDRYLEMQDDQARLGVNPGDTRYSSYKLPGGENYRELLLTLPQPERWELARRYGGGNALREKREFTSQQEAEEWAFENLSGNERAEMRVQRVEPAFRSSHFDEPNILAHVRFDERTDAEGRRVLFIEEFQSDWAQKGKREGFKPAGDEFYIRYDDGDLSDEMFPTREAAETFLGLSGKRGRVDRMHREGVPPAPFVGKTEAWVALAVKRMIRYAADNGFDRVAWTTGEQQADRYSLAKHVNSISWDERAEAPSDKHVFLDIKGSGAMQFIVDRNGVVSTTFISHGQDFTGQKLEDVIGKTAAEKVMGSEKGRIAGDGLKIGGEGMRSFYDRIVPNVVNDVLKKLGGGRVGTVNIQRPAKDGSFEEVSRMTEAQPQPGFDMTPEMREAVTGGVPMFARRETYGERLASLRDSERTMGQRVADLLHSDKALNWWHKSVGTQYHKATVDPEFGRVYTIGQDYLHEFSRSALDAAEQAPHLLPRIEGLRGVLQSLTGAAKQSDIAKVSKPLLEGTLQADDGDPHEGVVWTDDELRGQFGLTDVQVGLYREARAAIDASLDILLLSEVANLTRGEPVRQALARARQDPGNAGEIVGDELAELAQRAEPAERARLLDLATTLVEKQDLVSSLKAHGYAPLMRFGRFYVEAREGDEVVYFSLHETQSEANAVKREVRREFPGAEVSGGIKAEQSYALYKGLTPDTLELFAQTLGVGQDSVFQQYLKTAKSTRSAFKRLIHRKGVAGFEVDTVRSLASFITSNARAAAGNWHMGPLKEAAQQVSRGDVQDEAAKLVLYLSDPKEEAPALRGYLFIQYLGGSIASALVNMTQPLTMSYPYLAQYGAKRASAELPRAMLEAIAGAKVEPELEAALHRGEQEGIVAPHEVHALHAEAMRHLGSNLWVRRLVTTWGSLFSAAEAFNRRSTFIAAYRIGRELGVRSPYQFAVRAVEETQGVYNKGNRPNWARGAVGATIFTFKQFSIAYIEFLKRLPKREKALALAILFMLSGEEGLPFSEDVKDLIDTIAQSLGYSFNSRQEIRKLATDAFGRSGADFVMHGMTHLPGVPLDLQGRLGMGNLIPGTSVLKTSLTPEQRMREALQVLGPVGGAIGDAGEGIKAAIAGDVKGATKALPIVGSRAVQNVIQGVDMWQTGMYRDSKGRKVADTTPTEAVLKGVGFQPASVASKSKRVGEQMQNINLHKQVERRIADQWAAGEFERAIASTEAQRAAAREKISDARAELASWNRKNPDARIYISPLQIRSRVKAMRATREERIIKTAPREIRRDVGEELSE